MSHLLCVGTSGFLPSQRKRGRTVSRVFWGGWCNQGGRKEGAEFHMLGEERGFCLISGEGACNMHTRELGTCMCGLWSLDLYLETNPRLTVFVMAGSCCT